MQKRPQIKLYIQSKTLHGSMENISFDYRQKYEMSIVDREIATVISYELIDNKTTYSNKSIKRFNTDSQINYFI